MEMTVQELERTSRRERWEMERAIIEECLTMPVDKLSALAAILAGGLTPEGEAWCWDKLREVPRD